MAFSKNIFLLVWLAVMYLASQLMDVTQKEHVCGKTQYRLTWSFAILVFLPIVITATFRGVIGDTTMYRKGYDALPDTLGGLLQFLPTVTKDQGFTVLSGIIKCIFGSSTTIYFGILAIIQAICLIAVFRKYSSNYIISIFLFVASTDYISWMFNGIRQFMAVVFIFAATGLLLQRRWIPSVLVILLASTMHQSALLMIPVIFIVHGNAWNFKTILCLILTAIAVLYIDRFTDILDSMMQETQYENVVSDWKSWDDDGTNILRVVVYAVPTVLSLIGLRFIRYEGDQLINMCVNMSILSTALYIISMFTSGIFIGRLPIYMSLYNYILLPWEIEHMFTKPSARIVNFCMVGAYLVFNVVQTKFAFGL